MDESNVLRIDIHQWAREHQEACELCDGKDLCDTLALAIAQFSDIGVSVAH